LECVSASPASLPGPHHHVRSLRIFTESIPPVPFCLPETFADHFQSFTQVSRLTIQGFRYGGRAPWAVSFSDRHLVNMYFGGFGLSVRKLKLSSVELNMVTLKTLLGVLHNLKRLWILSCTMIDDGMENLEAFPETAPVRSVDKIVLRNSCHKILVRLATDLPLYCRELTTLKLGYTHDRDPAFKLNKFPALRELTMELPNCAVGYISDQVRLIETVTSTSLEKIVFSYDWGATAVLAYLEWETLDITLCKLMDRLDDGVTLEVLFADGWVSGTRPFKVVSCESVGGEYAELLKGVRKRKGIVNFKLDLKRAADLVNL